MPFEDKEGCLNIKIQTSCVGGGGIYATKKHQPLPGGVRDGVFEMLPVRIS